MTVATARGQKPWRVPSPRNRRGSSRPTWPRSIRSPSSDSTAGSSVRAAATADSTTRIAPVAREMKIVVGTISMPTSATTTVMPLNSTARLAVEPARSMAASFSRPSRRSSRYRETMNST